MPEGDVLGDAEAIPSRRASLGVRIETGRPSTASVPESAAKMPASTLMRVDLPAPFSPIQQWTSPALMSTLTSSSAWTPGNRFEMPVIVISGSDAANGTPRVLDVLVIASDTG
jgi:hypothetical protein